MNVYRVGRVLLTKDGRRIGNAIIFKVNQHETLGITYELRTDFGNTSVMTADEIEGLFYTGDDVIDPSQYLAEQMQKLDKFTTDRLIEEICNRVLQAMI